MRSPRQRAHLRPLGPEAADVLPLTPFGIVGRAERCRREGVQAALDADPKVAAAFAAQSAQNRFAMSFRVGNLKRPETRAARVAEYIQMLQRGETLYGA
ncbi:YdeI/OmpD-associated family protein [Microbacterium aurantiacum]|uniref:YdeI/OmpD-associated family protein n=1 Tax=Microbacterium aurantiacum TaxID=162393 RepID=UPI00287B6743|nr:YdeI/OmpD-associated family protein [Microbacterium aurantiacum]